MIKMYNGTLNMYFPCEVRNDAVSRFRNRWENMRKRQRRFVERHNLPKTNLIDRIDYRNQVESFLAQFHHNYLCKFHTGGTPYATRGIQKAYHGLREDMLFSKNTNAIVSTFSISFLSLKTR